MSVPANSKFFVCCSRAYTSKDSFAKHKLEVHSQIISFRNSRSENPQSIDRDATKIDIVPSKSMSISVRTIPLQQQMLPPRPKLQPQPSTSAAAIAAAASTQKSSETDLQNFYFANPSTSNGTSSSFEEEQPEDENDDQDLYSNAISQCTAVLKEEGDEVLSFEDENENDDQETSFVKPENPNDCTGFGYLIGEMQYRCNSCYKVTSSVPILKLHFESMHRPVKNNKKCGLCGINVKHRCNFTRHLRTCHIPEGIPCPFCTCTFFTQLGLNSHVVKIHSMEDQRNYVNIKPPRKSLLRQLLPKEEKPKPPVLNGNAQVKTDQNKQIIQKKAEEEVLQDLGEDNDDDPALYGNLKSEIVRTVGGKFYECRLCGKLMKSRINLRQHMLIHSGEKPLACVLCGIKFRFECNRRRHMRTCHSTHGEFMCTLCSCKFSSPVGLKVHISKYHNSSVPSKTAIKKTIAKLAAQAKFAKKPNIYQIRAVPQQIVNENSEEVHRCNVCGKLLNSKLNLRNHMLIHTGEKPETCQLCGQTFRLHSTLWGHMKVSHVENGAFPCNQCSCVFGTERGVIRHKVIYHNFHSLEYRRRGKRNRNKSSINRPLKAKLQAAVPQRKGTVYQQTVYYAA